MTVEATFLINDRGLVVVPGPLMDEYHGPASVQVELRKPDGTRIRADLTIQFFFQRPPPKERRWSCIFPLLQKEDVPVGSDIWLLGAQ